MEDETRTRSHSEELKKNLCVFILLFLPGEICGPKSIYAVVFVMAVKYTLVNEVNEIYKIKFASS